MPEQVLLGEVLTSYGRAGGGDPLVLLHPGGVDSRVLRSLVPGLATTFEVFSPDRRGHGRTPDVPGPISHDLMARDTVAFVEQVVGGPAALVGHDGGATVALLTALARPDLVTALVFVSGVFHHTAGRSGRSTSTRTARMSVAPSTPRCRRTSRERSTCSTRSWTACAARSRP